MPTGSKGEKCQSDVIGNAVKEKPQNDLAAQIMAAMVRMPPEQHKAAPKPMTAKGKAQRRRRENERQRSRKASA